MEAITVDYLKEVFFTYFIKMQYLLFFTWTWLKHFTRSMKKIFNEL